MVVSCPAIVDTRVGHAFSVALYKYGVHSNRGLNHAFRVARKATVEALEEGWPSVAHRALLIKYTGNPYAFLQTNGVREEKPPEISNVTDMIWRAYSNQKEQDGNAYQQNSTTDSGDLAG